MTEIDQDLYDAVMAVMTNNGEQYVHGFRNAATIAARISADRQRVPVSDEELLDVWHEAYVKRLLADKDHVALRSAPRVEARLAGIRAVRAALTAAISEAEKESDHE